MIACPACGADTGVVETRRNGTFARRRRRCVSTQCGHRITTMELIVPNPTRHSSNNDFVVVRRAWLSELQEIVGVLVAAPTVSDDPGDPEPGTEHGHHQEPAR